MASEFQQQKELYWKIRDDLMKKYKGKWVSIAQNKIVAVAESSTDVLRIAYEKTTTKIMYINKVSEEEKVMRKKIRRYSMEHDPAMPMVDVLISRLAEADIGGIGGGFERRALYGAMMEIGGNNVPAIVDCRNDTFEMIIGS